MGMALTNSKRIPPHDGGGNGHGSGAPKDRSSSLGWGGLEPLENDSRYQDSLHDAAYEAGYARGHEAGYRMGYNEGFKDRGQGTGIRDQGIGTREQRPGTRDGKAGSERAPGPRLLGLPCVKCGAWFFSDEAQCPRCNTVRSARKPQ